LPVASGQLPDGRRPGNRQLATGNSVIAHQTIVLFLGGIGAGVIGSIFGLGGGIIIVPLLVLILKIPIHYAVATSLLCVIATSSAVGSRNVQRGMMNLRLVSVLEIATVIGAICGGAIAGYLHPQQLEIVFAVAVSLLAIPMALSREVVMPAPPDHHDGGFVARLRGAYYDPALGHEVHYDVERLPVAMAISGVAGMASGLLGIGGGVIKVPALTLYSRVPVKAAAATSNFMIGVTAVASAFVYYGRGEVLPVVTATAVLGVFAGSRLGLVFAERAHSSVLRRVFAVLMLVIAAHMAWQAMR
jgi:hypothetical protein